MPKSQRSNPTHHGKAVVAARKGSSTRVHTLQSIHKSAQQLIHKLSAAQVLIGRGREAALKLDSELVSRKHAMLRRKHDEYELLDMNSSHGVFVNGMRVNSAILRDGDVIQLGDVILTYAEAQQILAARNVSNNSTDNSAVFVKIWGTRGSIPTPGPLTRCYGGNTSCYELRFGDAIFICDAGSGIRELGNDLVARGNGRIKVHLLLSHTHWDHVQGFPFFAPAYQANSKIIVYDKSPSDSKSFRMLSGQMGGDYFPVSFDDLKASITSGHLAGGSREIAGVYVSTFDQKHPGGSLGLAFEYRGVKIVYATDNEIDLTIADKGGRAAKPRKISRKQIDFVRDADLLIGDGQYREDEYSKHVGWGHPSILTLVDLAAQANVKCLAVTHHDPNRSDKEVDAMIEQARLRAKALGSNVEIYAAREGVELKLPSQHPTVMRRHPPRRV